MLKTIRAHPEASIIAGLFVILATIYSLVTPLFEASDEISHYPVVQHIATTGKLPVQEVGIETLWEQEGSQPPLYYLISAGLTFWIDTGDLQDLRWRNPHAKIGLSHHPDNKNMIIHTDAERFPWQGTALAMHLIRFFSVGLGTVSVILAYMLARTIWPDHKWIPILAMAIMAFNPMFLFITGSVNNDNLTVTLGTWILLLVARILKDGLTTRRAVTLSIVAALITITKVSGLTFAAIIGLALLFHALRTKEWKATIYTGLSLLAAWLVLASWWYVRNIVLYGEITGTQMHIAIVGGREIGLIEVIRQEYLSFWVALWAWFGAVNILADWFIYPTFAVLTGIALIGLLWWVFQKVKARESGDLILPGLLIIQIGIVLVAVIRWTMITYASQGRLMFPVFAAIATLIATGLLNWMPERYQAGGALIVGVPMLALAAISPFRYIAPAYQPPPYVASLPDDAIPASANFGDLELVGFKADPTRTAEDYEVPVTLYWRANAPLVENYSLFLHAAGRDLEEIGKIDTWPGGGKIPARFLKPGAILEDPYTIILGDMGEAFTAPTAVRVFVGTGVYGEEGFEIIEPTTSSGDPMNRIIIEAGVAYPENMTLCENAIPAEAESYGTVGDFARLSALALETPSEPGDSLPLHLYWDHWNNPGKDLTVFVQMLNSDGEIVAQADGPPLNGDYPTSLWKVPCQVEDIHLLTLPGDLAEGEYQVVIGMYDANDPNYARIPISSEDGTPYPNYAVPIGTITVEEP